MKTCFDWHVLGLLLWVAMGLSLSNCSVLIETSHTTVAAGAGAVATTATKNDAPVASAPAATATDVDKPKAPVATAPAAVATDYRKAAQDGGALATAPGSSASAVTTPTGPGLLWPGLAVVLVGCGVWALLKYFKYTRSGGPIYGLLRLLPRSNG